MRNSIILFLFPLFVSSQEVLIKSLPENINTNNAEINFIQINDTTAFFTTINAENLKLESKIYSVFLKNGNWQKSKYSAYNFDLFNTSNISPSDDGRVFLTICNSEMSGCRLVYMEKDKKETFYEIPPLSSDTFLNTQAFVTQHNLQRVLYFVSDRNGGFGGLDIWLLIIDVNGNFGVPINAGHKINSAADEITPFYNQYDGKIYFSSNRAEGVGGFDIYSSQGKLNLWESPQNVKELNSNKDDLYLNFYNKNKGYFSSNRSGAKFYNTEHCCNDIFAFEYLTSFLDTGKNLKEIYDYLPLQLYFHNDEPDPNTMRRKTTKTYKDAYISYFLQRPAYEQYNINTNSFFNDVLKEQFNNLNNVLQALIIDLEKGKKLEIQIKGYASPLYSAEYNKNLSQRRISSVINYLMQFKNGALKGYIASKSLTINELPYGEDNASENVSDDARKTNKSIYSTEAMLERKVEILDVILK